MYKEKYLKYNDINYFMDSRTGQIQQSYGA